MIMPMLQQQQSVLQPNSRSPSLRWKAYMRPLLRRNSTASKIKPRMNMLTACVVATQATTVKAQHSSTQSRAGHKECHQCIIPVLAAGAAQSTC